jgi:hypothetical protein
MNPKRRKVLQHISAVFGLLAAPFRSYATSTTASYTFSGVMSRLVLDSESFEICHVRSWEVLTTTLVDNGHHRTQDRP